MDHTIWRILDANANRAREALRVMEEHARFVLDDAMLAAEAKNLRHALAEALSAVDQAIVMRDTPGDVGTEIAGAGEYQRAATGDVLRAAGKRLSEALRVLEEYGKVVDNAGTLAARVERVRYRGYELEKRLAHTVAARERFSQVRLYVLITEALCKLPWREVVTACVEGGADCLQLREPELDGAALFDRAAEFRELCRKHDVLCIINDRADVAAAVDADGVHVGGRDLPVAAARRVVGPQRIIGVSTHTPAQAEAAAITCPDYIAVGPMFTTPLKPNYKVAGPETLRAVRERVSLPLVAIGGIDAINAQNVIDAGANCVAVCSAVIAADNPAGAARKIRDLFA